jgi:hypothetical protein
MAKLREELREQRGALQRLRARVPGFGGYCDREERREADKLLRDFGASRLERIGRDLQESIAKASLEEIGELNDLVQAVEKLRNELRFADRGYSGSSPRPSSTPTPRSTRSTRRTSGSSRRSRRSPPSSPTRTSPRPLRGSVKRLSLALADRRNAILGLGAR